MNNMKNTNQLPTDTCNNIVERRSGYGWTSGAGERAGAHTALCGKPTVDGSPHCRRHLNAHKALQAKLIAKRAKDVARLNRFTEDHAASKHEGSERAWAMQGCHECKRESK